MEGKASISQSPQLAPQLQSQPHPQPPPLDAAELRKKPTVIIVIGMAGSGKTTFMQRLIAHLTTTAKKPYVINLDPAVAQLPYGANIDIRDTVKYKEVMEQYKLGPNGGILTALNLFTTRFDQVMTFVEQRAMDLDYIIVDTPGQIEIFTWSASGAIISDSLAASCPTTIAYVADTPRCANPVTFMSNMLYACSILYKSQLPFLLVFNKTDIQPHEFAVEWMQDYDSFELALRRNPSFAGTLSRSMSLVLDEFYANIRTCGVSAITGSGMNAFLECVGECVEEYFSEYLEEQQHRRAARSEMDKEKQNGQIEKLKQDLAGASISGRRRPNSTEELEEYDSDEVDYSAVLGKDHGE